MREYSISLQDQQELFTLIGNGASESEIKQSELYRKLFTFPSPQRVSFDIATYFSLGKVLYMTNLIALSPYVTHVCLAKSGLRSLGAGIEAIVKVLASSKWFADKLETRFKDNQTISLADYERLKKCDIKLLSQFWSNEHREDLINHFGSPHFFEDYFFSMAGVCKSIVPMDASDPEKLQGIFL